jgi:hypothetical protein
MLSAADAEQVNEKKTYLDFSKNERQQLYLPPWASMILFEINNPKPVP